MMTHKTWFAALSKRSFLRYVLIYEIIPSDFIYKIDGQHTFGYETLRQFLGSDSWDENVVILELNQNFDSQVFLSLSAMRKVFLNSLEAKEKFLERGYENFDLEALDIGVHRPSERGASIDVIVAGKVDRIGFRHSMMWQDGVTALIHHQLLMGTSLSNLVGKCNNQSDLLLGLLHVDSTDRFETALAEQFASLCFANGIEDGWDSNSIVDQLYERVKVVESDFDDLDNWISALKNVLNGNLDKPLEAFAKVKSNDVGDEVKALAIKFSLLRTGYSLFSDHQRQEAGADRIVIQDVRAHLLNNNWRDLNSLERSNSGIQPAEELAGQSELFPAENKGQELPNWLIETGLLGNTKGFDLRGLDAKANFYPKLLVDEASSFLGFQLLDMTDEKSAKKATSKFAAIALNIQLDLPIGSRFEITESSFYLSLPFSWWQSSALKGKLSNVLVQISPLAIFKKNKDQITG
jgi:hypothetical protein